MKNSIAYFITSHGFGHAARACAVIHAIHRNDPQVKFEIFTATPAWFFEESLPEGTYSLHEVNVDVGLVQATPMSEDLPATLRQLRDYIPFQPQVLEKLAGQLNQAGCSLVVSDISPLGLAAAGKAGLPSVLVENFTWDWIYEAYLGESGEFLPFIHLLEEAFRGASYHVQTSPACLPALDADLDTAPVYREPRADPLQTRSELGISSEHKMVLVTMGGIPEQFSNQGSLRNHDDVKLVIPGGSSQVTKKGNLILLPHHSNFYHPDLVYAADAVVGKAGYSTVSEVFHAGKPFAFITRPRFRESGPMAEFILAEIPGFELSRAEFDSGGWIGRLDDLLAYEKVARFLPNGAGQLAAFLLGITQGGS